MGEFLPVLRTSPVFRGVTDAEIESMLGCLNARTGEYRKGSYLLRAGDRLEAVGLLLSGSVLIVQEDFWGNRNLMARAAAGQLFAESFACAEDAVLSVSVVADEACCVMWLDVRRILKICPTACAHHSLMIRNLLADIAEKNLRFNEKITHMSRRTTRDKLLSYLSSEAQRHGSPDFAIPFSRQQLADYLCVERSAMSAELGRLRDAGVLRFEKNHFSLCGQDAAGAARS